MKSQAKPAGPVLLKDTGNIRTWEDIPTVSTVTFHDEVKTPSDTIPAGSQARFYGFTCHTLPTFFLDKVPSGENSCRIVSLEALKDARIVLENGPKENWGQLP